MSAESQRFQEDVHKCVLKMIVDLMTLGDVHYRHSNLGVKITEKTLEDGAVEKKKKPVAIDFAVANTGFTRVKVRDMLKDLRNARDGKHDDTLFRFHNSPEVVEATLKKILDTVS